MKLRYVTTKNHVASEDIEKYAKEHNEPKLMVKQKLEDKVGPVLQYYDNNLGNWVDIDYVTEYRND